MGSIEGGSVVLSVLEFDLLWEAEGLPERHVALDVPSPGATRTERAQLAEQAWQSLTERGLARRHQACAEVVDMLHLLARPKASIDVWVWTDRQISGLTASTGNQALLGVVDDGQVWLIPARDSALAEAAVSVTGDAWPGMGHSVSLPHEVLLRADTDAHGDAGKLVTALEDHGVALSEAQELCGMLSGAVTRGQFGVQRLGRDNAVRRADRVVAFHDTEAGRYLFQVRSERDGRDWATITPASNQLLAGRVWELLDEV